MGFTRAPYSVYCYSALGLSPMFYSAVSWEVLYADDLVIIAKSLEKFVRRLLIWKEAIKEKTLRVNAGKTKVMICSTGLDMLQSSGVFPCTVWHACVGKIRVWWRLWTGSHFLCVNCQEEVERKTASSHISPPIF